MPCATRLWRQIPAAKLGPCRDIAALAELAGKAPSLVILDEAALDKAAVDPVILPAPYVLVLGGMDDRDGVTESFAKPFRLGHLITRVRYYLETAPKLQDSVVSFGPFRLEPQKRCVQCLIMRSRYV